MAANELTTNAVLHARTDFTVRVLFGAHRVRVEVSDGNTRMPQPCLTPADATSGRGPKGNSILIGAPGLAGPLVSIDV